MRLNLCSGQRPFGAGWTNLDSQVKWQPDIVADASKLDMIGDQMCEMVVIHHGLEHFKMTDVPKLLQECYRVLAPSGSLLIFIPDLKALAAKWLANEIDDYIFFVNCMGAYMGDEADLHRWHYTFASLSKALNENGIWRSIRKFDWRAIEGADIAKDYWILGVEGIK